MTNEPNERRSSKAATLLVAAVVSVGIAVAVVVLWVRHYKSTIVPPMPPAAPISAPAHEALREFVKLDACTAGSCHEVECEPFSDGQTRSQAAHVVRCRWVDFRDTADPKKCAYAHYLVDPSGTAFGEFFLSARGSGGACQSDKTFNDMIKGLGYTGPLP
jgi:hypothetical protein